MEKATPESIKICGASSHVVDKIPVAQSATKSKKLAIKETGGKGGLMWVRHIVKYRHTYIYIYIYVSKHDKTPIVQVYYMGDRRPCQPT